MKKKSKEEKWAPLGLFDLRAKGKLIHLQSQLNATLPCYLIGKLRVFFKVTAWARSGPSKSMMDVQSVLRAVPAKHLHLFPLRETINMGFLRWGTRLKYCITIYRLVTVLLGSHFLCACQYPAWDHCRRTLLMYIPQTHTWICSGADLSMLISRHWAVVLHSLSIQLPRERQTPVKWARKLNFGPLICDFI